MTEAPPPELARRFPLSQRLVEWGTAQRWEPVQDYARRIAGQMGRQGREMTRFSLDLARPRCKWITVQAFLTHRPLHYAGRPDH